MSIHRPTETTVSLMLRRFRFRRPTPRLLQILSSFCSKGIPLRLRALISSNQKSYCPPRSVVLSKGLTLGQNRGNIFVSSTKPTGGEHDDVAPIKRGYNRKLHFSGVERSRIFSTPNLGGKPFKPTVQWRSERSRAAFARRRQLAVHRRKPKTAHHRLQYFAVLQPPSGPKRADPSARIVKDQCGGTWTASILWKLHPVPDLCSDVLHVISGAGTGGFDGGS